MPLPASALTTLAKLKGQLGVSDSTRDAQLEDAINAASQMIADYFGRRIHYQSIVEERATGRGTPELTLAVAPIVSVVAIVVEGAALVPTTWESVGDDASAGIVRALTGGWTWSPGVVGEGIAHDPVVGHDRSNYLVTYTAGWITPNQQPVVGAQPLPASIEMACLFLATNLIAAMGTDVAVASESLMSYSVSYGNPETLYGEGGLPKRVEAMLSPHRWLVQE